MGVSVEAIQAGQRFSGDSALNRAVISRCIRRDAEAFGLLVDQYQARVYGFVRRMVPNADDAEDIAQEVFVRAFQNIHRFDGRASLATWLFKIAGNLCIDRARRQKRRPEEVPLAAGPAADGSELEAPDRRWDPESRAVALEMHEAVERAVAGLSEKLRSVLLLYDLEELSYDEIAAVAGIPVGTVKSRLFLARARIQDALNDYMEAGAEK